MSRFYSLTFSVIAEDLPKGYNNFSVCLVSHSEGFPKGPESERMESISLTAFKED